MSKIKLNLHKMNVAAKPQFARQVVTAMTGNDNYPNPDPPLDTITQAAEELEKSYNACNTARLDAVAKASSQDDSENKLDIALAKLANYVENASDRDESKILTAGMSVRAKASPIGSLSAPAALSATAGDMDGEIDLSWDCVHGAKTYVAEKSPDPITADSWKLIKISTKSSIKVTGLVSGTKYWFRVAGIGAAGQGPWSDPATKYAP
jgi:hypothetical protein